MLPAFPRCIADLDLFANETIGGGVQLEPTHPGFADEMFRKRHQVFVDIAKNYKHGLKIPEVAYTPEETALWSTLLRQLRQLYSTHACRQYNEMFSVLVNDGLYRDDRIPQLQDVSDFLEARTGFTLRPVAGLMTSRSFIAGLAFRVFHSTQYVRHPDNVMFAPEPDVIHELLGHAVMFANKEFADFSQEIGLASLGAPDQVIDRLEMCYRSTVEFGLCRENGGLRAYGAGLLSSPGELPYCLSNKPQVLEFDPVDASFCHHPPDEMQSVYYVADSFEQVQAKMREFAVTCERPFSVHYNAATKSVEILEKK